jgi:hypothetical protein
MIMTHREIRFDELVSRVVRSAAGRPIGRIEDLRARPEGEDYVVHEVLIRDLAPMPKLLRLAAQLPTLRALGLLRHPRLRAIPWSWLDLTDPERPRFQHAVPGQEP